jgi:hypothetical protein
MRESAGSAEIGTKEEGAITEMFELNDRLIIVKEKAIYEFVLADSVDPTRLNPDLPKSIQRLIINQGSESEMVARTFLTAKGLFKPQFLPDYIKTESATLLTLEMLQELSVLNSEIDDFLKTEKEVIAEYRARIKRQQSFVIPSVTDVQTRCKTIFQKADHLYQILIEIITTFYPNNNLIKQSHITTFYDLVKEQYGEDDSFTKFIKDSIDFFELIRAIRNCLDHRLPNIKIMNFELHITSSVITPTIEIDYRGVKLERQSLSQLLPYIYKNFIKVFETTIAYLCDKNAKQNLMQYRVAIIPPDRRLNKLINYSFWSPIGEGGYFYQ